MLAIHPKLLVRKPRRNPTTLSSPRSLTISSHSRNPSLTSGHSPLRASMALRRTPIRQRRATSRPHQCLRLGLSKWHRARVPTARLKLSNSSRTILLKQLNSRLATSVLRVLQLSGSDTTAAQRPAMSPITIQPWLAPAQLHLAFSNNRLLQTRTGAPALRVVHMAGRGQIWDPRMPGQWGMLGLRWEQREAAALREAAIEAAFQEQIPLAPEQGRHRVTCR